MTPTAQRPSDGGIPGTLPDTTWVDRAQDAVTSTTGTTITITLITAALTGAGVYLAMRRPSKGDLAKRLMYVPLILVNLAAIYGQLAFFYEHVAPTIWPVPGKIALAIVMALAIESISVYVGWHAHDALINKLGRTAARLRRASYGIATLVAAINYAHFADFTAATGNDLGLNAASVAFGLLSLISPWLWGLHSRRLKNLQLAKEGVADATGATFSGERLRSFPIRSYLARRWSIDRYVTDPRKAWEGYNRELRLRWAVDVDQPGWWMRINPAARVKQLTAALAGQQALSWAVSVHAANLTAELTAAREAVTAIEHTGAAQAARLAALTAERDALTGELQAARIDVEDLTDRLTETAAEIEAVKTELALTGQRHREETAALTARHTTELERVTAEGAEREKRLTDKHRADLASARAIAKTVNISDWRNRGTGKDRPVTTGKAELTDEAAVQLMLTAHPNPAHEWSKNAVRTVTGVGVGRAPKLIALWLTAATEQAAGGHADGSVAVNQ